jgi:uncharacterized Zn finger protein
MVRMTGAPSFTEADIERAAGARSFARGLEYVDAVANLELSQSRVTATVYGTHEYRVTLTFSGGQPDGSCTCPYGQEGFFCKHCVATALAVLELGDDLPVHIQASQARETLLLSWVESLSRKELLAELLDLITDDPRVRRRFELRAAAGHADADTIRLTVRQLVMVDDYFHYDNVGDYARNVGEAVDAIDGLIDVGAAAQAIGIAREALSLLFRAFEAVDDTSGLIGESGDELLAVHLRACQAAPPDPVALAEYLADLLLRKADYGITPGLGEYAGLLGEAGLARIRQRAAAAFEDSPHDYYARRLMETVLKAEGDVDALVVIYAAQLDDRGANHLRIARALDEAGRPGEAIDWAERGLREAALPDDELADYLAERYAADGRGADVLPLRWSRFAARRTLARYRTLRAAATQAGTWQTERGKALALLQSDAGVRPAAGHFDWPAAGPVLVDALLDDGDTDAVWTEVTTGAARDTVTEAQRVQVADALAQTRPADALRLYLAAIEPLKRQTGDRTYRRMAQLLLSVRGCHERLGTPDDFKRYLAVLRTDQKRKTNLMGVLDANGLR